MLFPTMISCCFRCSSARAIVEEELSLVHLAHFLTEQFPNFKQQEELKNNGSDKKANLHRADRWLLSHRFSVSFFMRKLSRFFILRLFFAKKNFSGLCKIGLTISKVILLRKWLNFESPRCRKGFLNPLTSFFLNEYELLRLSHYRIRQTIAESTPLDE